MNRRAWLRWESFLIGLFILAVAAFGLTTRNIFYFRNLFDMTFAFSEKALVALAMAFIIITANIDISVASTMALSSTVMGVSFMGGVPMWIAIIFGLLTGLACGLLNGWVITRFNLPAMIVTLANFSFFRGIAFVILGDQAVTGYPKFFQFLGRGYIPGTPIPFILAVFIVFAVVAGIILHRSKFGRMVYAIGWNEKTCIASGIPVNRIKRILFAASGTISALAAIFLTSRIGTTRPNLATGFELEIITIVILGGVVITGGQGKMWGVVLATFFVGLLRFGLGMNNVPGQYMLVITGGLLVMSILVNNLLQKIKNNQLLALNDLESFPR